MTKDKIIIFKSYKAMHKYASDLKKYYFSEKVNIRLLATDPDAILILTEFGENIEV
jgi:hypothetical protein